VVREVDAKVKVKMAKPKYAHVVSCKIKIEIRFTRQIYIYKADI